jgi:uncharacterized lipoprotein
MNRLRRLSLVLIAAVSLAGLPACSSDEAKNKADKAGNKAEKAAKKAKKEAQKAKKDVDGQ